MSLNFPTASPRQAANAGGLDAFVTKLAPLGNAILFSTYHGGTGTDRAADVAVDASGAYLVGSTRSTDFPVSGAFQGANAGETDAFITKLAASGSSIAYSSYLGGSLRDSARAVRVDDAGQAFVVGSTLSTDFPTANPLPLQNLNHGGFDAFIAKVNAGGNALLLSTYLGGSRHDRARGIALDANGEMFVTGETTSTANCTGCTGFPLASPMQPALAGTRDLFVTKLPVTGGLFTYSTLFGTTHIERSGGIGVDTSGIAYLAGSVTRATTSPTGVADTLIAAIAPNASLVTDTDGDSLPDDWERQFGLDASNAADAAADPDNDGVSNRDEYLRGTHPRGFYTRYLAEGAATAFFDVSIALANPTPAAPRRCCGSFCPRARSCRTWRLSIPCGARPSTRRRSPASPAPASRPSSNPMSPWWSIGR
jgi:hypothetical protein